MMLMSIASKVRKRIPHLNACRRLPRPETCLARMLGFEIGDVGGMRRDGIGRFEFGRESRCVGEIAGGPSRWGEEACANSLSILARSKIVVATGCFFPTGRWSGSGAFSGGRRIRLHAWCRAWQRQTSSCWHCASPPLLGYCIDGRFYPAAEQDGMFEVGHERKRQTMCRPTLDSGYTDQARGCGIVQSMGQDGSVG